MKISVAICTFNGEKFLSEQIDSILQQTLEVDEIIICDDKSTDQTHQIILEYQIQYPNLFKIHINNENLKSVKNFEKAISLCTGDIIFLSDQDDVWLNDKVKIIADFFNNNINVSAVATNGYGIDEEGNALDIYSLWDIPLFFKEKNIEINYFRITSISGNISTGASMAFRKALIKDIIPFPEISGLHHDEWIALNAASKNYFSFLPDKLFKYRVHSNQQVGNVFLEKNKKNKDDLISLFNYLPEKNSFKSYKRTLSKLSKSFNKNQELSKNKDFEKIGNLIINDLRILFNHHKNEMEKNYPVRSALLNFTDRILKKRILKD